MNDEKKCILCTVCLVGVGTECPFIFVCVLFQKESVVVVNGDGIFLIDD